MDVWKMWHCAILSVSWFTREAGSKRVANYGFVTTVKYTLIDKKHAFMVFGEVLRQFFKCLKHMDSPPRFHMTKFGLAIAYGFWWITCQTLSAEPSDDAKGNLQMHEQLPVSAWPWSRSSEPRKVLNVNK